MRLVCVSVVAAGALAVFAGPASPAQSTRGSARLAVRTVVSAINTVRAHYHLRALQISPRLSASADEHSLEMGRLGYFAHHSADGTSFWKRILRFYPSRGYHYWMVGENLLWSSAALTPAGAIQMWMQSPGHRRNLLDRRWRQIGLSVRSFSAAPGVYNGLDVTIISADFGLRY